MATTVGVNPLVADDNDSVSLNSTVSSEPVEGHMYVVEGILAEREDQGPKQYLVKWEGYPDLQCTWETESNFGSPETLREWEHQKMRIERGRDEPYDVEALEKRVAAWLAETKERKARRRAKRLRLGLPVASEEPDQQPDEELNLKKETSEASLTDKDVIVSSNQTSEVDLIPLITPQRSKLREHRRTRSAQSATIKSESDERHSHFVRQSQTREAIVKRRKRVASSSSSDEDIDMNTLSATDDSSTQDSLLEDIKARSSGKLEKSTEPRRTRRQRSKDSKQVPVTRNLDFGSRLPKKKIESRPIVNPPKIQKHSNSLASPVMRSGVSKVNLHKAAGSTSQQLGRVGSGPAKIGRPKKSTASSKKNQVSGAAILSNWDSNNKIRKATALQPSEALPESEKPRKFKKLSIKRRYEKAGRQEPAPNPDQLTFVDLKDGKAIKRPDKILTRSNQKTSFQRIEDQNQNKLADSPTTIAKELDAIDITPSDGTAMILDTQVESPQTTDADPWAGFQVQDAAFRKPTAPLIAPTDPAVLLEEMQTKTSDRDHRPLARDMPSPSAKVLREPELDSIRRQPLPPSDTSHLLKSISNVNSVIPKSIRNGLEVQRDNNYPRAPADVPSLSREKIDEHHFDSTPWHQPPSPSSNTPRINFVQPRFIIPAMSIRELRGDCGLSTRPNMTAQVEDLLDRYNIEDLSDVFGTIITGVDRSIKKDVRFRGLHKKEKQLFMTIKVPPREMHVWCKQICTASDYISYFHNVSPV